MTWYLDGAVAAAAFGMISGLFVPELVRSVPEPPDDPEEQERFGEEEPKELYADIAALPRLRVLSGLAGAVVGGLVGARLDLTWELLGVLVVIPVGIALFVIDARTRFLPTRLIAPLYGVVPVVAAAAALQRQEWEPLVSTAAGWAVYGGFFFLMWAVAPGGSMGYGDVRLAGLLGLSLGLASWGAVAVGMASGVALGAVVAILTTVLRRKKHYPYGPSLLVGAVVGAMFGPAFAHWYWPGS